MYTSPTEVKRLLSADPEKIREVIKEIEEQLDDLEKVHEGRLYRRDDVKKEVIGVMIAISTVLNQDEFDYIRKIYQRFDWGDVLRLNKMLYFMFEKSDIDMTMFAS